MLWSRSPPMRWLAHASVVIVVIVSLISRASATLVNITVDDTYGNPETGDQIVFIPTQGGVTWNLGQNCTVCTARPDPKQAYDGSWHDSTFSTTPENGGGENIQPEASLNFEGVAIYVYCITTGAFASLDLNSHMEFYMDGEPVGLFVQPIDGDPTWNYNVPVYVNDSLPSGPHNFTLVNGQKNGDLSITLLDYIVYTRDDSDATSSSVDAPSSTSSSTSISTATPPRSFAVLVAVVSIGATTVVTIIVGLAFYVRRRAKENSTISSFASDRYEDWGFDGDRPRPVPVYQQVIPYTIPTGEGVPYDGVWSKRRGGRVREGGQAQLVVRTDRTTLPAISSDGVGGEMPPASVRQYDTGMRSEHFTSASVLGPPPSYY